MPTFERDQLDALIN